MGLLRTIKSEYEFYESMDQECIVAIERTDCQKIKAFFKRNKGIKPLPSELITGYKMILDEEFDSLKIDFSNTFEFEIKNLHKL